MEEKNLMIVEERTVEQVTEQVRKIQNLMNDIMQVDQHYGKIPGAGDRPSLLKAGAEKLCFTFRLIPEFDITRRELKNDHIEYEIVCTLKNPNGEFMGQGVGLCSTMESKYRYRNDYETLYPVPKAYWDARNSGNAERAQDLIGKGNTTKKIDNQWMVVTPSGKKENPDIADCYNTVLKMAKKRAHVDATITACAASDIFTQDVEDLPQFSEEPKTTYNDNPAIKPAKTETKTGNTATKTGNSDTKGGITESQVLEALEGSTLPGNEKADWKQKYLDKKNNPVAFKKFGEHIIDMIAARAGEEKMKDVTPEDDSQEPPEKDDIY